MRFAAKVPGGIAGKWLFSRAPSHQRSRAPRLAPTQIATIDFHIHLSFDTQDTVPRELCRGGAKLSACLWGGYSSARACTAGPRDLMVERTRELPLVERSVVRLVVLDSNDNILLLHTRDLHNPA